MNNDDQLIEWEDRRREHLSAAIALLLGLSSASLAFSCSLLAVDAITWGGWRTCLFIATVACFTAALGASLAVTFTRLLDARETARLVRKKMESATDGYVEMLRNKAQTFGKATWFLLYAQLTFFSLGAIFLLLLLSLIYGTKLFP
jgi:hypothetical protein